eukprot:3586837-Prymnesium_polylepis.1
MLTTLATSGAVRAGGTAWALAFDGFKGTTISLQWKRTPLSALTLSYFVKNLDPHLQQTPVFAYSAYSVTGRYGEGGLPVRSAGTPTAVLCSLAIDQGLHPDMITVRECQRV